MVNYSSSNKTIFQIPTTSLKINGSNSRYPVGRVFCIGTNYQNHAVEMGSSLTSEPTFFMKPFNSVCQIDELTLPDNAKNVHHEVELVVCLKAGGKNINLKDAKKYIYGYAVGLDLTKRDVQNYLKKNKKSWELSKVFDFSAPLSKIEKLEKVIIDDNEISLKINGVVKQKSNISKMIYSVEFLISYLSKQMMLFPGDLIFTGTPEGVGPIKQGDLVSAKIEGISELEIKIF